MIAHRTILAALILTALPALAQSDSSAASPSSTQIASSAKMRESLAKQLLAQEKTGNIDALLKDDTYRKTLAAHEILRVTGDEALATLHGRYPHFKTFLSTFLSDREWTEAYLSAGSIPTDTVNGLETLYRLWKADGASKDFKKYKHLSAAIGATWGIAGKRPDKLRAAYDFKPFNIDPVRRFKFFKTKHQAKRLHPLFDDLKSWELRYVVEKAWDDASYVWLNENINIPLQSYVDAFTAVRYRGESDFGDTIQGPLYYIPWESTMCQAENTKIHGGVCGSLSTFGAVAASAHGIPSYTVGSPSHCAYAVRFARGDWRGGFGGPDGGPHTAAVWEGNFHFVELMEKVYGDDDGLNLALAHAARARLLLASDDLIAAEKAIEAALEASPFHLDLRRLHFEILEKSGRMKPADWRKHAEGILTTFKSHSDPAIQLTQTIEPKFLSTYSDKEKIDWYTSVHTAAAHTPTLGAWGWNFPNLILKPQFDSLESNASREELLKHCLGTYLDCKDSAYFGMVIDWGIKAFADKGMTDAFFKIFSNTLASESNGLDDEKLKKICEKGIKASIAAKSIPAFQAISKRGVKFARKETGPQKLDIPAGKLVSHEGMIYSSSQAWCSIFDFYNVLNETGCLIHTNQEQNPWVVVQLPSTVDVSGILVVKNNNNQQRMKKMRISRSVDGENWFPIEETPNMQNQWRINPPADTMARYIKIEALNDRPEFMHLSNFLIYSK